MVYARVDHDQQKIPTGRSISPHESEDQFCAFAFYRCQANKVKPTAGSLVLIHLHASQSSTPHSTDP